MSLVHATFVPYIGISTVPFDNAANYQVLLNHRPYGFAPDIKHMVVWIRNRISTVADVGDMTPESKESVGHIVQRCLTAKVGGEGARDRVLQSKNWGVVCSVRTIDHIHVLVRNVDQKIVAEWIKR